MTDLQIKYNQALETQRANKAKEIETNRSNLAQEYEKHRSNIVNESQNDRKIKLEEEFQPHRITESKQHATYYSKAGANQLSQALSNFLGLGNGLIKLLGSL